MLSTSRFPYQTDFGAHTLIPSSLVILMLALAMPRVAMGGADLPAPDIVSAETRHAPRDTLPADSIALRPFPADTYRDPGVRALIERAREVRGREIQGIESYEAVLRERVYVGLRGRAFRRERSMFELEQVANIRWSRDGDRIVQWVGARRDIPIAGMVGMSDDETLRQLEASLSRSGSPAAMAFDPGDDRLAFGTGVALHPLADTAAYRYRYRSGDTLTVRLPEQDRTITMVEALVEPREASFNLVAGSLWFDRESGSLVRAVFRPARPFDLDLDRPEDASDVPRLLKPIRAEIQYIAIDYSLHDFEWWLPRRFAFEGEAQIGAFLRIPITFEWTVGGYLVNPLESQLGLDDLPPGWMRSERRVRGGDAEPRYVTIIVPPGDLLLSFPDLSEELGGGAPTTFSADEIRDIRSSLDGLLPGMHGFKPRFMWGLGQDLVRFNRVEGLSVGVAAELPLHSRYTSGATARIGLADLEPNGELWIERGPVGQSTRLTGYRRLAHGAHQSNPMSLSSSLVNLALGNSSVPFYRATGLELESIREGRRVRLTSRLFHESNAPAFRETDFHLRGLFNDDTTAVNIFAERGRVTGTRVRLDGWAGLDPDRLRAFGSVTGEAGAGDLGYQRLHASLGITRPIAGGVAGALEVAAGTVFSGTPVQRLFYLGDTPALRAREGPLLDERFWTVRGELANDFPLARLILFGDLGWAGSRDDLTTRGYTAAIGVGGSLLDGVLRADLSRGVRGRSDFYLRVYVDGLF